MANGIIAPIGLKTWSHGQPPIKVHVLGGTEPKKEVSARTQNKQQQVHDGMTHTNNQRSIFAASS